jgi:hypothetical protein
MRFMHLQIASSPSYNLTNCHDNNETIIKLDNSNHVIQPTENYLYCQINVKHMSVWEGGELFTHICDFILQATTLTITTLFCAGFGKKI